MHLSNNLLRVYIFADAPHMLKLARNHLLDHGFVYCGNIIDKKCLQLLLQLRMKDLTIAHKLTKQHLNVVGTGRQKVKPAAQLVRTRTYRLRNLNKAIFHKSLERNKKKKMYKMSNKRPVTK